MDKKIVIIGAGPAGLGAAYRLQELGYQNWEIYEKDDYIGGLAASFKDDMGFVWDVGGHVLFSRYRYFDGLLTERFDGELIEHERRAYIRIRDRLVPYPFQNNIKYLPPDIYSECLNSLVKVQDKKADSGNFEEWILYTFGEGIAKYFMFPHNWKLWAHPLKIMSKDWVSGSISAVKIEQLERNSSQDKADISWGMNKRFKYPLYGGIGGLWQKFLPLMKGHINFKKKVVKINVDKKEITFFNGESADYGVIINTMPLDDFISKANLTPLSDEAAKLKHNGIFVVGFGIKGSCPKDRNWMYFPENNCPFYRVSYISNYSPHNVPSHDYFSLLAETSYSEFKPVSKDRIIEETLRGLINCDLLKEEEKKNIVSTYSIDVPYAYPVPTLERDGALQRIQSYLSSNDIYSCGRFGGWKYEASSIDDSVNQGKEAIDALLLK